MLIVCILVGTGTFFTGASFAHAAPTSYYTYNDTVLVVNDASATSTTIANYFMQARGLSATWATTHVVHINTPPVENIGIYTFNTDIRPVIKNFLIKNGIASSTNYIITTKGVPLKVGGTASVDQEIGLILGKYASKIGIWGGAFNPYDTKNTIFSSKKYGFYIVTRLTGYTIPDIERMIDHSDNATTTSSGTFVLDTNPVRMVNTPVGMVAAGAILKAKGYSVILDKTNAYLTYQKNVLGYYSWGSNDGHATTTHSIPHNTYVNGAIGDTGVSTSGRSFATGTIYGQSLIADWLANGISGMQGYTSEPFVGGLSQAGILFDRYTDGYNMADSFGMADGSIGYKQVDVGDPKMVIVKHMIFFVTSPSTNAIASSTSVTFKWNAMQDYYGISKYQLYVDGTLAKDNITGTSTTITLPAGSHTWYIKAFANNGYVATSTEGYTIKSNINGLTTVYTHISTINVIPGYTQDHTFYVDSVKGSDTNDGSVSSPWKSVQKAALTAQAGDTVILIDNPEVPYRGVLNSRNNGITFEGTDPKHKAELWGSVDVSGGWTLATSTAPAGTYEKNGAAVQFFAGPSITSLTQRAKGTSLATIAPGQWYQATTTLYYYPLSSENIVTLHIEVSHGGNGGINRDITKQMFNTTLKNLIVRYVAGNGITLTSGDTAQNVAVYYATADGFKINGDRTFLKNSIVAHSRIGLYMWWAGATVENNLFYDNTKYGVYVNGLWNSTTIRNNISYGNSASDFYISYLNNSLFLSASHNAWNGATDATWKTYMGTHNLASTSPLFVSTTTKDFSLTQFSPLIGYGTTTPGVTTDFLGNPIYGAPDIGPFEYQPPYTMGTNHPSAGAHIRLYANGKYRYLSATSTASTSALTVTPVGGWPTNDYRNYMDITIGAWNTSGTDARTWVESSPMATSTVNTIGNLKANTYYEVTVDGKLYADKSSNSAGQFIFTYKGGYTTHTFHLQKDTANPIITSTQPKTDIRITYTMKPTFSWGASDPSGIASYTLTIDKAVVTNVASTTTSYTPTASLVCGSHTWSLRVLDNAGNSTKKTQSFILCNNGFSFPASSFSASIDPLPGADMPTQKKQTLFTATSTISTHATSTSKAILHKPLTKTARIALVRHLQTQLIAALEQLIIILKKEIALSMQ